LFVHLLPSFSGRQEVAAQDDLDAVPGDFCALASGVRKHKKIFN
jgi:hypothetical protein